MSDLPADGLGTQLRRLLELLDGDLESLYREDHAFYVPRYTPVMKALEGSEPVTIKDIAHLSSVSHSAASQTVSRLAKHGLVSLKPDSDRRSRIVSLTAKGRDLMPWLRQRWSATQAAANALESDVGHPLSLILRDAISALEKRSFADRIRAFETKNEIP